MDLKKNTWSLILVMMVCYFRAVSTTGTEIVETVMISSPSSSSSFSSSSSMSKSFVSSSPQKVVYSESDPGVLTDSNLLERLSLLGNDQQHVQTTTYVTTSYSTQIIPIKRINLEMQAYVEPVEYSKIIPSHVLESVHVASRFRENAIFIIGYLLQSPNSRLTVEQYNSLKLIYNALQRNQVQMYHLLPVLNKLHGQSKTMQLITLMDELSKYLPQHYSCSASFWKSQIQSKAFNPDTVFIKENDNFDLFNGITKNDLRIIEKYRKDDCMAGYDESSKLTEKLVGQVFVKIFKSITANKLNLSQQLFSVLLSNLPNPQGDVIFEEYVRYLEEITWRNGIPNWKEKQSNPNCNEPYVLISTITDKICSDKQVPFDVKRAMSYIKDRFANKQDYIVPARESHMITGKGGLDVNLLLSIITPGEFSNRAVHLKNDLLKYTYTTHNNIVQNVLNGMNTYGYSNAKSLLLAFLTRLHTRLPIEHIEIRKTVSALLSIVQLKLQAWNLVQPFGSVSMWSLLDVINDSKLYPKSSKLVQKILPKFSGNYEIWKIVQNVKVPHTMHCTVPEDCLNLFLKEISKSLSTSPSIKLSPEEMRTIHDLMISVREEGGHIDSKKIKITELRDNDRYRSTPQHGVKIVELQEETHRIRTPEHELIKIKPHPNDHLKTPPKHMVPLTPKSAPGPHHIKITPETPSKIVSKQIKTVIETVPKNAPFIKEEIPIEHELIKIKPHPKDHHKTPPKHKVPLTPKSAPGQHHIKITPPTPSKIVSKQIKTVIETVPKNAPFIKEEIPIEHELIKIKPHPKDHHKTPPKHKVPLTPKSAPGQHHIKITPQTPSKIVSKQIKTVIETVPKNAPFIKEEIPIEHELLKIKPHPKDHHKTPPKHSVPLTPKSAPDQHLIKITPPSPSKIVSKQIKTVIETVPKNAPFIKEEIPIEHELIKIKPHPKDHHKTPPKHSVPLTPKSAPDQHLIKITPPTPSKIVSKQIKTVIETVPKNAPFIEEEIPIVPLHLNPNRHIEIEVTENNVPTFQRFSTTDHPTKKSKNIISVPSAVCLEILPSDADSRKECETDIEIAIKKHLIETFGKDYRTVMLGKDWKDRYTTKVSLLLALLDNAKNNPKIQSQQKLLTDIKRYNVAVKSVSTYVFLPLIAQQQKLDNKIIWSTFDSKNPKKCNLQPHRPEKISSDMIALPLVNPKEWLLTVDVKKPFDNILPDLPEDSPYAQQLQPLKKIFTSKEIYNILGSNWNPSVYPNRGALLICVLRTLANQESVKKNIQLHTLVRNYLRAIQLPSTNVHIPNSYMQIVDRQYHTATVTPQSPMELSKIKTVIPGTLNPDIRMQMVVSDNGVPSIRTLATPEEYLEIENVLSLPSVTYLQEAPNVGKPHNNRDIDIDVHVKKILIDAFGENYEKAILGDYSKDLYPTRLSLYTDLLEKAQKNAKIMQQAKYGNLIKKYQTTLKSVGSYVFLPMAINNQKINSPVVWLTYDNNNPLHASIQSVPSQRINKNMISLPLVNPKTWLLRVDTIKPFADLIPKFVESESSYAIETQPLTKIIQTGEIYKLLGPDFKISQFPNRGALYTTALYTLLMSNEVKKNTQLYTLLKHYLKAIELSSMNAHITNDDTKFAVDQWKIERQKIRKNFDSRVANFIKRNDIFFSALIDPNKDLQVKMRRSNPIYVETLRALQQASSDSLTLPSINCLQSSPDEVNDIYCDDIAEIDVLKPIIKTLGNNYAEHLLGNKWDTYPTMSAFLDDLFKAAMKNDKIAKQHKLVEDIRIYRAALEFASVSIFLPLLSAYQRIDSEIIWVTYDTKNLFQSQMSLHAFDRNNPNIVSLPLVNPKIWLQSVDVEHPLSNFIPNLPPNHPYASKIRPLIMLLNSGEAQQLLENHWIASSYPHRGALFVSTLRMLSNLRTIQSNKELYTLVQNYLNVMEIVSFYVHIPRSWINDVYTKNDYVWTVDLADLNTALPFPHTELDHRHFYTLQKFLLTKNLLNILNINMPVLSTSKADFLIIIIERALKSKTLQINTELRVALEYYYKAKAEIALASRGDVVHWICIPRSEAQIGSIKIAHLNIGNIFTITIPLSQLKTIDEKVQYFKLIKFMNDHRQLFNTTTFKFYKYSTYGQFLRAYFTHLIHKSNIDENIKKYMLTAIKAIRNTGPGATPMPKW